MKVFTLVLSLLLSFNLFAANADLGALIDDHQFFLTIEWDQKDQGMLAAREKVFTEKFAEIAGRTHLTQEEMIAVLGERVHSPNLLKRLKSIRPGVDGLKAFLSEAKGDLYTRGASWNGEGVVNVSILVALVLITAGAVYFATSSKKDIDCHYDNNAYGCKGPGVCTEYGQVWSCSTSTYTDTYDQTRTQETCGYYEACVKYAK